MYSQFVMHGQKKTLSYLILCHGFQPPYFPQFFSTTVSSLYHTWCKK